MAAVQSPLMAQVQGFLDEYVSKIPAHSTIGVALDTINSMSLQEKKEVAYRRPGGKEQEIVKYDCVISVYSSAGWDWSTRAIVISSFRCVVTYLALQALAYVSLCINGAVGAGKIVLGFTLTSVNYENAQEFLEEGIFQLLTAVYDYAVGQFGLICSVFALIEGFSPETALDTHTKVFQAYKGTIEHKEDEEDDPQANFCMIQRLADTLQEMMLPSKAGDYVANVGKAWGGDSPLRVKRLQRVKLEDIQE